MGTQVERRREPAEAHVSHVARGDLGALDALDVESVGLFCWSDEKPLCGPVGFLDWRLCGAISRTLERGLFEARRLEVMLAPARSRLKVKRIFAFGLGPTSEMTSSALHLACRRAYEVMTRAGVERLVLLAPSARSKPELEREFLRALEEELPGRIDLVLVEHAA